MRQKTANPKIVEKYIDFLEVVKIQSNEHRITLQELVKNRNINKSVIKAFYELKIIQRHETSAYHYKWIGEEPSKLQALEVLNYCLELGKKQIVTPISGLDEDTKGYIKAIHDRLISNSQKQNTSRDPIKDGILARALNQAPMNTNTLLSEVQSEQDKKFELLKSIAPGVYNASLCFIMNSGDSASIESTNLFLIEAAEDLFNKFFKVK